MPGLVIRKCMIDCFQEGMLMTLFLSMVMKMISILVRCCMTDEMKGVEELILEGNNEVGKNHDKNQQEFKYGFRLFHVSCW